MLKAGRERSQSPSHSLLMETKIRDLSGTPREPGACRTISGPLHQFTATSICQLDSTAPISVSSVQRDPWVVLYPSLATTSWEGTYLNNRRQVRPLKGPSLARLGPFSDMQIKVGAVWCRC